MQRVSHIGSSPAFSARTLTATASTCANSVYDSRTRSPVSASSSAKAIVSASSGVSTYVAGSPGSGSLPCRASYPHSDRRVAYRPDAVCAPIIAGRKSPQRSPGAANGSTAFAVSKDARSFAPSGVPGASSASRRAP